MSRAFEDVGAPGTAKDQAGFPDAMQEEEVRERKAVVRRWLRCVALAGEWLRLRFRFQLGLDSRSEVYIADGYNPDQCN